MDEIEAHPCLVVAAIEGFCLGGGLELALACDARIAGDGATFGLPEVGRDLLPTWGGHHRLSRVVGLGRAKEIVLLGRRLDTAEALACGLLAERVAGRHGARPRAGRRRRRRRGVEPRHDRALQGARHRRLLADARTAREADAARRGRPDMNPLRPKEPR